MPRKARTARKGRSARQTKISSYKRSKPGKSKKKTVRVKGHARVLKVGRQRKVKQTARGLKVDGPKHAMSPGKRRSKSGNIYYEHRSNRSDRYVDGKRKT